MTNLPPTHQDVLCLLSQALHATRLPESTSRALNNHPDWPAILREAAQQAVLPLVLEAALTLPPDQQPPGGVLAIYRDQAIQEWRRQFSHLDEETLAYIYTFSTYTNIGVIERWITHDFHETPEQLAQLTHTLLYRGTSAFLRA